MNYTIRIKNARDKALDQIVHHSQASRLEEYFTIQLEQARLLPKSSDLQVCNILNHASDPTRHKADWQFTMDWAMGIIAREEISRRGEWRFRVLSNGTMCPSNY
jgi:hypothetical protein